MTKILPDTNFLKNKRIIFFGNERLVSGLPKTNAPILSGLIEQGYTVVAVVSHYAEGVSRTQRTLEVADIAKNHGIPLLLPNKPSEIIDDITSLNPDIAVLVAYGRIINQEVIDLFPQGIINIHPSLLPQYRGPTPIESAILNGDQKTGVSIMQLSAGMDDGPVYIQQPVVLRGNETKFELYQTIDTTATSLFFENFPQILAQKLHPLPQVGTPVYSTLIKKSDSHIDWNQPAIAIERTIRAYEGWPQSQTVLNGIEVIITKAHATDSPATTPGDLNVGKTYLRVGTGTGELEITALKPIGKKEMPVAAFLAGYGARLRN